MFKSAREGVHNDFPSDKHCAHQKVLRVEAAHTRTADKLEVFSEERENHTAHVLNKIDFLVFAIAAFPR